MKQPVHCPSEKWMFHHPGGELDAERAAHLESCSVCRDAWQAYARFSTLAAELPARSPDPQRMAEVRRRVLSSTQTPHRPYRRHGRVAAAAAVLLLAIVCVLVATGRLSDMQDVEQLRGRVHPHDGARYVVVQPQPDEIVRLTQGTITVRVSPLKPNERFRVVVGDGHVEVKGTVFDVSANEDRLTHVRVISGIVVVRYENGPESTLLAGDTWQPRPAPPREERAGTPSQSRRSETSAKISTTTSTRLDTEMSRLRRRRTTTAGSRHNNAHRFESQETERKRSAEAAFRQGWGRLQDGDPAAAADAFEKSLTLSRAASVSEDAAYWLGAAYSRAELPRKALVALDAFIEHYPSSPRLAEATLLMGRAALDVGDTTKAEHCFERVSHAPSRRLQALAKEGLAAIRRTKK